MKKKFVAILFCCCSILIIFLFCTGCTSNKETKPTPSNTESAETELQKQRFDSFATTYNAIDWENFETDMDNLNFSSEIVRKYNGISVAKYDFDFDDIFIDENSQYIGTSLFGDDSYYIIPENLYDKIIQNEGHCDGIIYKLRKIEPQYQLNYSDTEVNGGIDEKYVDVDVETNYNYSFNRCFYFDIIDVYIEQ